MRKFLASRGGLTAMVIIIGIASFAVADVVHTASTPTRIGCADLPDGTGIFAGSSVNQFGVRIGTVDSVQPLAGDGATTTPNRVRARFTVEADRVFPSDVGAVTVADSLVAQRRLELVGVPQKNRPSFDFRSCISDSKTPKSITESLDALSAVVDQFSAAGGSAQFQKAMDAIPTVGRALQGTGPQVAQLTEHLAELTRNPGPGMSDVAAILDAFAPAAGGLATNWPEIERLLSTFGTDLQNGLVELLKAGNIFAPGLTDTLITLRSLISKYGVFAVPALHVSAPVAEIAAGQMPRIVTAIRLLPALQSAFTTMPGTDGGTAITLVRQREEVDIRVADPNGLCRKVNERRSGSCTVVNGKARVDPMNAALALAGAAQ